MKRIMMIAVAVSFVFMLALPAMALETEITGRYYVEGVKQEHPDLQDNDENDYYNMELRLRPVFKLSDNLSLITRFDALSKKWGTGDTTTLTYGANATTAVPTVTGIEDDDNNIDWDRAYMRIKSDIGLFLVGRQKGNTWGTSFGESEGERDRITWVVPINNLYIAAVYEKNAEYDGDDTTEKEADNDKYYLTATYKAENFKAGMLYGYYKYNTFQDMAQASDTAAAQALAKAAGYDLAAYLALAPAFPDGGALYFALLGAGINPANFSTCTGKAHVLIPYFEGKFGPFGVQGEVAYVSAKADYDTLNNAGTLEKDVALLAYNLEGSYDIGPVTLQAGYGYASGDADYTDDKIESYGYIEPGTDWGKTLILYSDIVGLESALGGLGNPVGGGKTCWDGYAVYYLGVDFNATENLSFGFIYAKSKADETSVNWDDDHGAEYDLTLTWKVFDNLTYTASAAFLDAGDYWDQGGTIDVEDTYVLYHKLQLEF